VGEDDELTDRLEQARGVWAIDESAKPDVGKPVGDSITKANGELNGFEISLLLGMAVMSAIAMPIGYHGLRIPNQMWTERHAHPPSP
jgi:hypothetical protein